ncbi:MAG TPA: helix-turn-helix domain-containing protein, partial [Allosphingosinicella sp.]|nr:helix-turn-helix domain-containing protein [Allosphingosinicella sp.]
MTDVEDGEGEVFVSTGEQLKRAREAKGLSLDDVANQTRIPIRHLQAIEREEWDALPAPTYAVGFARNYANAVGLDGAAIGLELRERLGGAVRSRAPTPEYYEPADPSRMPPRGLVIGAVVFAALLIAVYFFWFSSYRSEQVPDLEVPAEGPAAAPAATAPAQPAAN